MSGPILPRSLRAKPPLQVLVARWLMVIAIVVLLLFGLLKLLSFGISLITSGPHEVVPTITASPTEAESPVAKSRCQDKDIVIRVELSESEMVVDQEITITAYISSISTENCFRDVGASANQIAIFNSAGSKVWSSNRCSVNNKQNLVTLLPGDIFKVTVPWYGYKNSKDCDGEINPIQPGELKVVASNGNSISEPATLTIIK